MKRATLARLLLPIALVALLFPLHIHHGEELSAAAETLAHACDCGPGSAQSSLSAPHAHDGGDLCWDAHETALPALFVQSLKLTPQVRLRAIGSPDGGTPLRRRPACRGPPQHSRV